MKTIENIKSYYMEYEKYSYKKYMSRDKFGNKTHKKFGSGYVKRSVVGKAVDNCKKHKSCLVTIISKINDKIVKLMLIDKDVKEGEIIYTDNSSGLYVLYTEFIDVIKDYNLTPDELSNFLIQKHITEKIINS